MSPSTIVWVRVESSVEAAAGNIMFIDAPQRELAGRSVPG